MSDKENEVMLDIGLDLEVAPLNEEQSKEVKDTTEELLKTEALIEAEEALQLADVSEGAVEGTLGELKVGTKEETYSATKLSFLEAAVADDDKEIAEFAESIKHNFIRIPEGKRLGIFCDVHLTQKTVESMVNAKASSISDLLRIEKTIEKYNLDYILLAGDIFNENLTSFGFFKTIERILKRINQSCTVLAILGNHDHSNRTKLTDSSFFNLVHDGLLTLVSEIAFGDTNFFGMHLYDFSYDKKTYLTLQKKYKFTGAVYHDNIIDEYYGSKMHIGKQYDPTVRLNSVLDADEAFEIDTESIKQSIKSVYDFEEGTPEFNMAFTSEYGRAIAAHLFNEPSSFSSADYMTLLDNVDLAIVAHIHRRVGLRKVRFKGNEVWMWHPGSVGRRAYADAHMRDFAEIPVIALSGTEIMLDSIYMDLDPVALTFKEAEIIKTKMREHTFDEFTQSVEKLNFTFESLDQELSKSGLPSDTVKLSQSVLHGEVVSLSDLRELYTSANLDVDRKLREEAVRVAEMKSLNLEEKPSDSTFELRESISEEEAESRLSNLSTNFDAISTGDDTGDLAEKINQELEHIEEAVANYNENRPAVVEKETDYSTEQPFTAETEVEVLVEVIVEPQVKPVTVSPTTLLADEEEITL